MSPEIVSIRLFGKPFSVLWPDGRRFANHETCYCLVSFEGSEDYDQECLRQGLPVEITPCWLPNPGYVRNAFREDSKWVHDTGRPCNRRAQAAISAYYFPPEARGLLLVDPRDARVSPSPKENLHASLALLPIIRSVFRIPCSGLVSSLLSKPGVRAFLATFSTGHVRFFKNVVQCPMPREALAFFQAAELQSVIKVEAEKGRKAVRTMLEGERWGRLRMENDFNKVRFGEDYYDLRAANPLDSASSSCSRNERFRQKRRCTLRARSNRMCCSKLTASRSSTRKPEFKTTSAASSAASVRH